MRNIARTGEALLARLDERVRNIERKRPVAATPTTDTAERPDPATVGVGIMFYDTTLGRPIWSNGVVWHDAAGSPV